MIEQASASRMYLEAYFQVNSPDDVRFAGTRVPLQAVLYEYVHPGRTVEEIVASLDGSLRPDQIPAAILWYLTHRVEGDAYLSRGLTREEAAAAEQENDPRWEGQRQRLRAARAGKA